MPKTILIVEDDELNLRLFNDLLESEGYQTLTASTADEARAAVARAVPDLILMDVELSNEMSGLDLAQELHRREELRNVPVVVVTAHALSGDAERIRGYGCAGYITKPISPNGFLEAVGRYV